MGGAGRQAGRQEAGRPVGRPGFTYVCAGAAAARWPSQARRLNASSGCTHFLAATAEPATGLLLLLLLDTTTQPGCASCQTKGTHYLAATLKPSTRLLLLSVREMGWWPFTASRYAVTGQRGLVTSILTPAGQGAEGA